MTKPFVLLAVLTLVKNSCLIKIKSATPNIRILNRLLPNMFPKASPGSFKITVAVILVINSGWGFQGPLQSNGSVQRRRPPETIDFPYFLRDIYPSLGTHLLSDDLLRKYQRYNSGARLFFIRLYERRHRLGKVWQYGVPFFRYALFV